MRSLLPSHHDFFEMLWMIDAIPDRKYDKSLLQGNY
jgi:hypothetical protein